MAGRAASSSAAQVGKLGRPSASRSFGLLMDRHPKICTFEAQPVGQLWSIEGSRFGVQPGPAK